MNVKVFSDEDYTISELEDWCKREDSTFYILEGCNKVIKFLGGLGFRKVKIYFYSREYNPYKYETFRYETLTECVAIMNSI